MCRVTRCTCQLKEAIRILAICFILQSAASDVEEQVQKWDLRCRGAGGCYFPGYGAAKHVHASSQASRVQGYDERVINKPAEMSDVRLSSSVIVHGIKVDTNQKHSWRQTCGDAKGLMILAAMRDVPRGQDDVEKPAT